MAKGHGERLRSGSWRARRRGVLIDFLARHAPGVRLTGLAAGFHAVAHLPDSADEQAVVTAARQRSVGGVRASGARCWAADPVEARPGTIRGDSALDVMYNVVPGSGSPESAGQHIKNVLPSLLTPFPAGRCAAAAAAPVSAVNIISSRSLR